MVARSRVHPRPSSNFELYGWFFMRISAIVLFLLVGFHLFYMHVILGVDAINFAVISQRWTSPIWRLYDFFMLSFGWLHCTNGVRIVLDDYVHGHGWRLFVKAILYLFGFFVLVLGAYVVFTFRPS